MKILFILALLLAAIMPLYAQDVPSVPEPSIMARVTVASDAEMQRVMQLGLDLMEYREGQDLIFLTTQTELDRMLAQGFDARIDETLTARLPQPGQDTFGGGYLTVEETNAHLTQMGAAYSNLAEVFTYGQSWQRIHTAGGYDLTGIKLTNRSIAGPKPTFLLEGGIHAREYTTPEMATRFIDYLLTNYGVDADATWLLDEHEIIVLPQYNPDGRKIAETGQLKRKNMNSTTGGCSQVNLGIDLNRNFSFSWGVVNRPTDPPCGETWPGLSANSEPETLAVQTLMRSLWPDQRPPDRTIPAPLDSTGIFMDLHSYGNLVLYPWGQDNLPPPNLQLRTIARKAATYNGYDPIQTIQLYPTSGTSQDFTYGELGVAGFGMEIGGSGSCGGFMPAYSCMDGGAGGNFWNLDRPVLLYMAKLARTPYMTGEGPITTNLLAKGIGTAWKFRATISDVSNGNQNITAAEAYVDTPPWRGGTPIVMFPQDGSFNSPTEAAQGGAAMSAGRHIIYIHGRDSAGNWGPFTAIFKMTLLADLEHSEGVV